MKGKYKMTNLGQEDVFEYEKSKAARAEMYPYRRHMESTAARFASALESLNENGYAILPGLVDRNLVLEVKALVASCLEQGRNLRSTRNVAALAGDRDFTKAERIPEHELAKGVDHYRELANYVDVQRPLINCPSLVQIALDDNLLSILGTYLECAPGLTYLKLRTSFVNSLDDFDTNLFHTDGNGPRIAKAFVYLNDVDEDEGPTTYVKGTHLERDPDWNIDDRFTLEEMVDRYGESAIVPLVAEVGDVVIADPTGYHRGTKPAAKDRSIVLLNYDVVPETIGYAAETPAMNPCKYPTHSE